MLPTRWAAEDHLPAVGLAEHHPAEEVFVVVLVTGSHRHPADVELRLQFFVLYAGLRRWGIGFEGMQAPVMLLLMVLVKPVVSRQKHQRIQSLPTAPCYHVEEPLQNLN